MALGLTLSFGMPERRAFNIKNAQSIFKVTDTP